jgi:hypothetical protein
MIASLLFGIGITLITALIGLTLGLPLLHGLTLLAAIVIAATCFSAIGTLMAVPPTNVPSNIMMLASLIKFPLVFISGIFVPLEQMPFWGLALAVVSPLTYFNRLGPVLVHGDALLPGLGRSRCHSRFSRWCLPPSRWSCTKDHAEEDVITPFFWFSIHASPCYDKTFINTFT